MNENFKLLDYEERKQVKILFQVRRITEVNNRKRYCISKKEKNAYFQSFLSIGFIILNNLVMAILLFNIRCILLYIIFYLLYINYYILDNFIVKNDKVMPLNYTYLKE